MAPKKSKVAKRQRKTSPGRKRAVERALEGVTSAERHRRFLRIADMLAEQWTGAQIVRTVSAEYDISERQAYSDLAEVYAQCRVDDVADQGIRLTRARLMWQRRIRRCEAKGDEPSANYAADRLCKLDGLYAPKKVELTATVGVVVQMRTVLSALDAIGLAALDVVMQQLAAKGIGALPGMAAALLPEAAGATS